MNTVSLTDHQAELLLTLVQQAREDNENHPSEVFRTQRESDLSDLDNLLWDALQDSSNPWA